MVNPQLEASEPDRKRPRIDEPASSHSSPNFTNHPTLYFCDGNVILLCQKTYFRVHRTLLTRNSTVFREILVQRERVGDQFRGCILLTLDDDVDDMENLLNRVYDGLYVVKISPQHDYKLTFVSDIDVSELTPSTFPALASILRLSMKYQIERPQKAIFELLRREWPSTLEKYDAKMTAERATMAAEGADPEEYTVIHPATVIALLRKCGYSSADLFAPLFYSLSTYLWQFANTVSPYPLGGLSTLDTQRLVLGVNKLRAFHVREAQCPIGVVPHQACRSALVVGWCGEAYNILHFQGNDMCRPLESWAALISRIELPSQPEASVSRAVPSEHLGPAAPPPYNALPGGGRDHQHWPAAQEFVALPGLFRRTLVAPPGYDHYRLAHALPGVAQGYLVQQVVPPAPMTMPPHQPQHPGPAPPFVHPSQVPPQPHMPHPLFENLCGSCRQSVIQSLEASRQKIWDSLPELFKLV